MAKRLPVGECLPVCTHTMEATNPVSTPGVSTSKFWASYGIPPPLTPQENANPTLFNVGSCPPTKRPNRSQESKDKTAAKRALATRAVKVWEALKIHIEKGVSVMTDIDDIAGLHRYIGKAEASWKNINDLTDLYDLKVRRLRAELQSKEAKLELEYHREWEELRMENTLEWEELRKDRKKNMLELDKREKELDEREAELDKREAEVEAGVVEVEEEEEEEVAVDSSMMMMVNKDEYNEKMKELYSLRRKLKDPTRGQGGRKDSSDSNSSNRAGGEGNSMDTTTNE